MSATGWEAREVTQEVRAGTALQGWCQGRAVPQAHPASCLAPGRGLRGTPKTVHSIDCSLQGPSKQPHLQPWARWPTALGWQWTDSMDGGWQQPPLGRQGRGCVRWGSDLVSSWVGLQQPLWEWLREGSRAGLFLSKCLLAAWMGGENTRGFCYKLKHAPNHTHTPPAQTRACGQRQCRVRSVIVAVWAQTWGTGGARRGCSGLVSLGLPAGQRPR